MRERIDPGKRYDLAVVGGGIHGAAVAWEAALLGAGVALFEAEDFAAGTSANSLKIIHGGLRYLQHFDLARSRAYAKEQDRLIGWFPHLVQPLECVMPTYKNWKKGRLAMGCGIQFYEALVWPRALPRGGLLPVAEARAKLGGAWREDMTGGASWYDAQVYNGERLVLSYALSARQHGADVFNHVQVRGLAKRDAEMELQLHDRLAGSEHTVRARYVIDARGASEQDLDQAGNAERSNGAGGQAYTRAVNIVFDKRYSETAIGLQLSGATNTGDARLLFLTPWRGVTLAGTWYFPDRPQRIITRDELDACFADLRAVYPALDGSRQHVRWVHVGRLPLAADNTSLLDRPRLLPSSRWPEVIKLVGVKYSNARRVAETLATRLFGAARAQRQIYGGGFGDWVQYRADTMRRYGESVAAATLERLLFNYGSQCTRILDDYVAGAPGQLQGSDILLAEVAFACDHEAAYTLGDVLLRRTGLGALGPPAAETVTHCAAVLARRFGWDEQRVQREIDEIGDYYQRVISE